MNWKDRLKEYSLKYAHTLLGMDIGSTTAKLVIVKQGKIILEKYERHYSMVRTKALELLANAGELLKDGPFYAAISGSAGLGLANETGIPFVQEVFATAQVVEVLEPETDSVVELGGEDAKIIFFKGGMDERMNGTCAGGTGAFIDQMATLLDMSTDEMDEISLNHERIYPIASRCGVFAKTDIQPLLNQGAKKADIAASIYQAVVDQTIAGLAQGRKIEGHVMFLGGPLSYCKGLRDRFKTSLKLSDEDAVFPEFGKISVALGAALYGASQGTLFEYEKLLEAFKEAERSRAVVIGLPPLFKTKEDYSRFKARHSRADVKRLDISRYRGDAYLGIDCGSTTTKLVLISPEGEILYSYYGNNQGNPVDVVKTQLEEIYKLSGDSFDIGSKGYESRITIRGAAVTGYGEELIIRAFHLDGGLVETMAHYSAARYFNPDVDFIIDIGGQDMKCLSIKNNSIDSIILNEACSSGCGSFIETFARAMGYSAAEFAQLGIKSTTPVDLGSRCTVFMNSSVKQAQKDGAGVEDISAGLSISVVKNALFKVLRVRSADELGKNIVVQGGTFLNDAVLRSFEQELGADVIRPEIAGLMGAFGAALYARKLGLEKSSIIDAAQLKSFTHTSRSFTCGGCTNHCPLTVSTFYGSEKFVSGNKCEKGGLAAMGSGKKKEALPNIYRYKREKLAALGNVEGKNAPTIGLPMSLGMLELAPMWHRIFSDLGFNIKMTGFSDKKLYAKGVYTISSDTACYPAKLMHGHVQSLIDQGCDAIFYPSLTYNIDEAGKHDNHYNCPVVAYYAEVLGGNITDLKPGQLLYPYLNINDDKYLAEGLYKCLSQKFSFIDRSSVAAAVKSGRAAYEEWMNDIRSEGLKALEYARNNHKNIIVLCGRPYHVDSGISQGIDQLIEDLGFVVVSEDCVSGLVDPVDVNVLNQWIYHARLYNAAKYVCLNDDCNLVQLVSFGCGLDAVTTDEVRSILEKNGKLYTQLKIDEISNLGAVKIRLRSLMGALQERANG